MTGKSRIRAVLTVAGAVLTLSVMLGTAQASDEIPTDDLQAATRSIGFLDSIPHDGTIFIGVVYDPAAPGGKEAAEAATKDLTAIAGPKSAVIRSVAMSVANLAHTADRLDAVFLMPGSASASGAIADAIRQRHVVSISDDPACLEANCCVLMVRSGQRIEIVLDTGLADAVGAHFSTVFTMMVKRK
jgi:hypothetical protein